MIKSPPLSERLLSSKKTQEIISVVISICILGTFLMLSLFFLEKVYMRYANYTEEKANLLQEIAKTQESLSAQKKLRADTEIQSWLEKLNTPLDERNFESFVKDLAKRMHCHLDQMLLQKREHAFTKGTLKFSSMSDSDVMDLIDVIREKAHNSLVIQSLTIERAKDFSDHALETLANHETVDFFFSAHLEFMFLHNDKGVGRDQDTSLPHAEGHGLGKNSPPSAEKNTSREKRND